MTTRRTPAMLGILLLTILLGAHVSAANVNIAPAPAGEPLSADYALTVRGKPVPVYECKVAPADKALRWKAMDDKTNSALYFEKAAFCYFDAAGTRLPTP